MTSHWFPVILWGALESLWTGTVFHFIYLMFICRKSPKSGASCPKVMLKNVSFGLLLYHLLITVSCRPIRRLHSTRLGGSAFSFQVQVCVIYLSSIFNLWLYPEMSRLFSLFILFESTYRCIFICLFPIRLVSSDFFHEPLSCCNVSHISQVLLGFHSKLCV